MHLHHALKCAGRRGMKELDMLLGPYLRACQRRALHAQEAEVLCAFLQEEDPSLFAWLMQHEEAPHDYQALIADIRTEYRRSLSPTLA